MAEWDGMQILRNISAFVVVLLLLYVVLRYGLGAFNRKLNRGVLKVLERVMLDPRRGNALYLVQVGQTCYVIGTSQNGVNLITELPQEEVEKIQDEQLIDDSSAPNVSFLEMFNYFQKKQK